MVIRVLVSLDVTQSAPWKYGVFKWVSTTVKDSNWVRKSSSFCIRINLLLQSVASDDEGDEKPEEGEGRDNEDERNEEATAAKCSESEDKPTDNNGTGREAQGENESDSQQPDGLKCDLKNGSQTSQLDGQVDACV